MTRLLVTNDDGVDADGLHVLARRLRHHGDVVVVAPDAEYSGSSAALGALHLMHPEVRRVDLAGLPEVWAVNGPPALCVLFARLGVFGPPFDLVVSGINPGANVGRAVYHSGTVGAALTARNGGISGVAVSQAVAGFGIEGQAWDEMLVGQQWETAAAVADVVVGALLAEPPAEPVVVNLNVPNRPLGQVRAWRRTAVGTVPPRVVDAARLVPKAGHEGAYTVELSWGEEQVLPAHTDGGALEQGEVSVTFLGRLAAVEAGGGAAVDTALTRLVGA